MNQQQRFEAFYAKQHDIDPEDVAGYRMGDSYRLPGIAGHYRTLKAAEDGASGQSGAPIKREAVEVEAYLVRSKVAPNHRGVRLFVDPSCYDADTEALPLMTIAQHERIVSALERKP